MAGLDVDYLMIVIDKIINPLTPKEYLGGLVRHALELVSNEPSMKSLVLKIMDPGQSAEQKRLLKEDLRSMGGAGPAAVDPKLPDSMANNPSEEMMEVDGAIGGEQVNSFEEKKEMLVELERAGVEGVEDMVVEKCPTCGFAWIDQRSGFRSRKAGCPSPLCSKEWCRNCSRECHDGRCADGGAGRMKQWRLPVQGFSLRPVLRRREFSDDPDTAEFMKAEAIVLRGLRQGSCSNLRSFEVVKVEIVENPRLKRKFEAKRSKEVEEGSSGESLMLFHGTPKENILQIVQYNFDPTIINNGRAYGDGVYFSECPEVSLGYTYRRRGGGQRQFHENDDGNFTLILCEVLKGSLPVFKEVHTQGDTGRASAIVVTDVERLLPRYVVTLGCPNSSGDSGPASQILGRSSFPRPSRLGNFRLGAQSSGPGPSTSVFPSRPVAYTHCSQRSSTAPLQPAPVNSCMTNSPTPLCSQWDVLGNLPSLGGMTWTALPPTPAFLPTPAFPPMPALPPIPAPATPSQPASYSPAITGCTCCGEPGWRRTRCRHSSPPPTSWDQTSPVTGSRSPRPSLSQDQNGKSSSLNVFSAESADTDDPSVVDPVTDALAAAVYKVLEQLELKVSELWKNNGTGEKLTLKLVSESGVEQEVVVPHNLPVRDVLEDYCRKRGTNMMKLVFDGKTVLLGETPKSLGMEDGDMVEVMPSSDEREPLSSEAVRRAVSEALGSMSIRRSGK